MYIFFYTAAWAIFQFDPIHEITSKAQFIIAIGYIYLFSYFFLFS